MSYPMDKCPHCGAWLSGVRCDNCRYTGSKSEFINNGHRCPKCGSSVNIPGSGSSSGSQLGCTVLIILIIIGFVVVTNYFKARKAVKQVEFSSFTDPRNNRLYKTFIINGQEWMAENLNLSIFQNGDPVIKPNTNEEWVLCAENSKPACCFYNNDPAKGELYGKLYNWYAAHDERGLCPGGWHVATETDWNMLIEYFGAKNQIGKKLKAASGWPENGNGSNSSGFSGLPGGMRTSQGDFLNVDSFGHWLSSTDYYSYVKSYYLSSGDNKLTKISGDKGSGFSVRCVRSY